MKTLIATTGSFLFTTAVIGNAFYHKKQFYSSMVYLTKSSPSMGVSQSINYIKCIYFILIYLVLFIIFSML